MMTEIKLLDKYLKETGKRYSFYFFKFSGKPGVFKINIWDLEEDDIEYIEGIFKDRDCKILIQENLLCITYH